MISHLLHQGVLADMDGLTITAVAAEEDPGRVVEAMDRSGILDRAGLEMIVEEMIGVQRGSGGAMKEPWAVSGRNARDVGRTRSCSVPEASRMMRTNLRG
jgi:hypothetical protein